MLEKHHKHVSYEKKNYFIIGHLSDDCRAQSETLGDCVKILIFAS